MFVGKKKYEELEAENQNLVQWVEYLKGTEAVEVTRQVGVMRSQLAEIGQRIAAANASLQQTQLQLAQAQSRIVETDEMAILQEVGIYTYRHPLDDAVAYKAKLKQVQDSLKALVKSGGAVSAVSNFTFNNSLKKGAKLIQDLSKLMLRAYNSEADNIIRTLKPYKTASAIGRLDKAKESIAKLGSIIDLRITDDYHRWRVYEIELTSDYLAKVEEEKERLKEERARQREEEKAMREFEAEKRRLEKEQAHYQSALEKLREKGNEQEVSEMEAKLSEISAAIEGVENREANIRAGYVYVISNFGSFGEHVVKIGLTRRLDPMDRVRELGDASVPFNFDVHAMIFSDDAVSLENNLHQYFAERRLNLVNLRREYFYTTPQEVRDALIKIGGQQLLEFNEMPEAVDWRTSGGETRRDDLLVLLNQPASAQ
ncbi:MAG: DUF4041 domain-containing protein [Candidatus Geothermincolia bacterium]